MRESSSYTDICLDDDISMDSAINAGLVAVRVDTSSVMYEATVIHVEPMRARIRVETDQQSVRPAFHVEHASNILESVSEFIDPSRISDEVILEALMKQEYPEVMGPKRSIDVQFHITKIQRADPSDAQ